MGADGAAVDVGTGFLGAGFGGGEAEAVLASACIEGFGLLHCSLLCVCSFGCKKVMGVLCWTGGAGKIRVEVEVEV